MRQLPSAPHKRPPRPGDRNIGSSTSPERFLTQQQQLRRQRQLQRERLRQLQQERQSAQQRQSQRLSQATHEAERRIASLRARNQALRSQITAAGLLLPDHEEWKELNAVGITLSDAPRADELVLARRSEDGGIFVTGDFGLTPDEERVIATNETFRSAYRADPKATLDLIRRILGAGDTNQ